MKLSGRGWSVLAVALIGAGGLTMTQFAATQETQTAKKVEPAPKGVSKSTKKDDAKATPAQQALSKFMRRKLDASQKILEGLALEDFELIQEGAATLEDMSTAEKWRVSNDPFFRKHSKDFQKITKRLATNAKEENLEGSALTWLEATMQCIECHKWTRANLIADKLEGTRSE